MHASDSEDARMDELKKVPLRAKGGIARATLLTPQELSISGKRAAIARWSKGENLPAATHEGPLTIGDLEIPSAVLADETRVLGSKAFLTALGRPWKGTYKRTKFPNFIEAANLSEFITKDLEDVLEPIEYRNKRGAKVLGYNAKLLPEVIEVYLKARSKGVLRGRQREIADQAEILGRGLMRMGIIGLVDEATGFQEDRAKDALSKILNDFIAKELQPYIPTFPKAYYLGMFRLRGLSFPVDTVKRPQYFGILTNDIIYKRLAPNVLEELKKATLKDTVGRNKTKLFQMLTANKGYPKLREHLGAVIATMNLSSNWHDFKMKMDRHYPRFDTATQYSLDLTTVEDDGTGL
jgi:hypothetical protein